MTTRATPPRGAPCWVDLWTSDVEGSRAFYAELFGWEAGEPSPEFGGYFTFTRDGAPIAGAMGDMGDMKANDTWKIYLATPDIAKAMEVAESEGAELFGPPMPVADLGVQAMFTDPAGAHLGAWQPGTHQGFTVLAEPGAPSWFELWTRDHDRAIAFYRAVFGWETDPLPPEHGITYSTVRDPRGAEPLAGVMDATNMLPEGAGPHWTVYWDVLDIDASVTRIASLGGKIVAEPSDSPYGRIATVTDPAGAELRLRMANP